MAAGRSSIVSNFMSQFRDTTTKELKNLTSAQFLHIWRNYDKDGNGFIEGRELDSFLREFISAVSDTNSEAVSEATLLEIREHFMETYDNNKDGKIEIREMAQLLPLEESFLLLFRFHNPLDSSIEFMKIWRKYDTDNSGSIDAEELKNFLRDILTSSSGEDIEEAQLGDYTQNVLQIFDANGDGKLSLSEMAKLLPVKENFLLNHKLTKKLTKDDIERIFSMYDQDNNGSIENEELNGFLKDLLEMVKKDDESVDLETFKQSILSICDTNNDGKVDRKELTMILMAINRDPDEQ